ncbi:f-box domain-containing protein [Gigaspora margarita]|uniref:F-box domain-containing protein n=1 Tax=Gigaspora margarita TaxID=4874 RepID=A0A8H3WZE8_GIGMA|nr:f-box domain-containing protein [Gigaspora margarita]
MNTLPNECLFDIFNNLRTDYGSLFSCLILSRQWCRIVVPLLWSEPTVRFSSLSITSVFLSTLNDEEQAMIPFETILPNYVKPLFEYTSFTISVGDRLYDGIDYYFSEENTFFKNAVKCSLISMFLRTSKILKNLSIKFNGIIQDKIIKDLCRNTTIVSLNIDKKLFSSEVIEIINENVTITSLKLLGNHLSFEGNCELAEALCMNTTLTSLVLFGDLRLDILAKAICKK